MEPTSKLLTTGDVARLCGFSPSAVLQWIRGGKLAAYSSPGGQYRVDPQELLSFLREHNMRVPPELSPEEGYRILIVDDDERIRDLFVQILTESDIPCVVETAKNGVVGCMKIPIFKPHLVTLDIVMPELDGVEMCRSVKATDKFGDIKVLLVTGFPDDERLQAALDAGADDWLAKPVDVRLLIEKVSTLLGISSSSSTTRGAEASPSEG